MISGWLVYNDWPVLGIQYGKEVSLVSDKIKKNRQESEYVSGNVNLKHTIIICKDSTLTNLW